MKKLLLVAFSILTMSMTGYTQAYEQVSCSTFGTNANSCDQCFDGGSKYVGDVFKPNDVFNAGSNDRLYFDDENPIVYSFQNLNANASWFVSNDLLRYPDTFVWNTLDNRKVHAFRAGTNERFLETQDGKGIRLQSVATDNVNPNTPAFKFTFTSKYRTWLGGRNIGDLQEHRECIFYKPNYCGDGIVQTGKGETCDPSDSSRSGWGNGGCDTNTCQPIETPTCNGLTVTPTFGTTPVNSTVTCEGYKVNTFKIDCGNGQVFTGNGNNLGTEQFTKTCNYTAGGTYAATCFVNDSITNNSCRETVNVTNPVPSITIDKRDQNSADLDGNIGNDRQTVNAGDTAIFRITVTNNGAEGLEDVEINDPRAPTCNKTEVQTLTFIQNIGNRDNVFDIGESFSYLCEKSNTTDSYTNVITVVADGIVSGDDVNATDDTDVLLAQTYDLALIKTVIGSKVVYKRGDSVQYAITVYNQGDIDANNIEITDYIPTGMTLDDATWTLSGNIATRNIGSIAAGGFKTVTIELKIGNNVSGNIVNWAEISSDDGDDCDSTPDQTQSNDTFSGDNNLGNGCNPGGDEDDHDPASIMVSDASIAILKYSANQNDLDGNIDNSNATNDTQTVTTGSGAVFKIKVTNTGTEDLNDIVLTDTIATNCAGVITLPGTVPSTWSNLILSGNGDHTNNVLEPGEIFEYTCIKANTTQNYTNIATVNANSAITGSSVPEVSDPSQVRVGFYDLALIKRVTGGAVSFAPGDTLTYDITVINQGTIDATNVVVTDYGSDGLLAIGGGGTFNIDIGNIAAGEQVVYTTPSFTILGNATSENTINWAEISSADGGTDIDSTPDTDNTNDCHGGLDRDSISPSDDDRVDGTGDTNGNGNCETGEDEDDHDPALITIVTGTTPSITIDKTDANSADRDGSTGNDTQTVNSGDEAVFRITVTNNGAEDLKDLVLTDAEAGNCAGTVTLPSTYPSSFSNFVLSGDGDHGDAIFQIGEVFTYTCIKANTTSDYTNSARVDALGVTSNTPVDATDTTPVIIYVAPPSSSSSSSGGGSSPACRNIDVSLNTDATTGTVVCTGNSKVKSFKLDCGNGQILRQSDRNSSTFACDYTAIVDGGTYGPATYGAVCSVSGTSTPPAEGSTAWKTRFACKTDIPMPQNFCGDGILQVPNDAGVREQCERVINSDGTLGDFPNACTSACKLRGSSSSSSSSSSGGPVITIPNGGDIKFYPQGKVIIGDSMEAFESFGGRNPTIVNESDYDLHFDELCILKTGNSLNGDPVKCIPMGGILYPWDERSFSDADIAGYTGKISGITSGDYGDNNLQTTIKSDGTLYRDSYFAANLKVRVSKPSLATTGGGTSYLNDTDDVADTRNLGQGIFVDNTNRNFEGVSIANNNALSNSTVTETTNNTVAVSEGADYEDNVDEVVDTVAGTGVDKELTSVTDTYNGISNVYVVNGGDNLVISSDTVIPNSVTYLVKDGGNLIIKGNITSAKNIAFVVKGGDIIVHPNVTKLTGTYISIGGEIKGTGVKTSDQLVVNGSLYGNVNNLISDRTYVKADTNGQISVGTIVSFGSGIFKKPAPLVGQFIGEYLESKKVAN